MVMTFESFIDFIDDEHSEKIFESSNPNKENPILTKAKAIWRAIKEFFTTTLPNFFKKLFKIPVHKDQEVAAAIKEVKDQSEELKKYNKELGDNIRDSESTLGSGAQLATDADLRKREEKLSWFKKYFPTVSKVFKSMKEKINKCTAVVKSKMKANEKNLNKADKSADSGTDKVESKMVIRVKKRQPSTT